MASTVTASNGVQIPDNGLGQSFAYDDSGNVTTITQIYSGITYVQTFTYTDGAVTNISQWVAQ